MTSVASTDGRTEGQTNDMMILVYSLLRREGYNYRSVIRNLTQIVLVFMYVANYSTYLFYPSVPVFSRAIGNGFHEDCSFLTPESYYVLDLWNPYAYFPFTAFISFVKKKSVNDNLLLFEFFFHSMLSYTVHVKARGREYQTQCHDKFDAHTVIY